MPVEPVPPIEEFDEYGTPNRRCSLCVHGTRVDKYKTPDGQGLSRRFTGEWVECALDDCHRRWDNTCPNWGRRPGPMITKSKRKRPRRPKSWR